MRYGSLFAGYGGLELGVQSVLGGSTAWHCEIEPAPSKILAHHWPDVPNLGDITQVDWSAVEPVDVLTGGFPCQDVSHAGKRLGLKPGTRSGLWSHMAYAIDQLRPRLVVAENVRGLLSAEAASDLEPCAWCVGDGAGSPLRALGAVLGDLAELGYDAQWHGVRASDAGAPHGRFRVFVFAQDANVPARGERWLAAPGQAEGGRAWADARGRGRAPAADADRDGLTRLAERDGVSGTGREDRGDGYDADGLARARDVTWGDYEPAVRRWEALTRPAPSPTDTTGKNGQPRLSPAFVEWMMGLPAGHVTNPAIGLTRNEQLKALGNGVVPQQAALATRLWLAARSQVAA